MLLSLRRIDVGNSQQLLSCLFQFQESLLLKETRLMAATPELICCWIVASSLAAACLMSQPHHASADSMAPLFLSSVLSGKDSQQDRDRVNLSVYYESLCPYSANFTVNYLANIFKTDLINIVNLRLVPWGNAQTQSNDTWTCQHGEDECLLNAVQACAISVWPGVATHFKFIHCIERLHLMRRRTEWWSCFNENSLDPGPIIGCYNNGLGHQLEQAYADETAHLSPPHTYVPWVMVNNFPLQQDYQNFISYTCRAYRGRHVPNACKSNKINLSETEISTPQVTPRGEVKT